jgi:thiol-disulfide isomerase/thioredoxin
MYTMSLLKLGPLILIVNLFFSISAIAESKYAEKTQDIVKGELRKFIFSEKTEVLPKPLILDANENMVEIGYDEDILIINFWATWCAPCKKEMPSLNSLAQNMKYEDIQIITIASGRNSKEAIDGFFDDNNLVNLKKYRDPRGRIAVKYGVTALPTTVVINPTGLEIGRIIGDIDWDTADVRSFFKKLLETK